MRNSESEFHQIRGLRYHVRRWRSAGAPKMVLLHGWMDVSASFQFLVDSLDSFRAQRPYDSNFSTHDSCNSVSGNFRA